MSEDAHQAEPAQEPNHLRPVLIFAGVTLTVGLAGILWLLMQEGESTPKTKVVNLAQRRIDVEPTMKVPEFDLQRAHGGTLSRDDLRGKIWIIDFMYTTCPTICPEMTESMKIVEEQTRGLAEVAFLSVSVDPERDDAKTLREYAKSKELSTRRWHFLHGPIEKVHALSLKGFALGDPEEPIVGHSNRFALVDETGAVRGFYHGIRRRQLPDLGELVEDIRELVARRDA